jgi:feruloyl-CoA synthase
MPLEELMYAIPRLPEELFVAPAVLLETQRDGTQRLRSTIPLPATYARCVGEWLEYWAHETPDAVFLAERRNDGTWIELRYGEALLRVTRVATWLLDRNVSADRPVAVLSENGIEHALLMLACMHIGVPCAPLSPGKSLLSRDFGRLRANFELLRPGVVYADPVERYLPALDAVRNLHDGVVLAGSRSAETSGAIRFVDIERNADTVAVAQAFAAVAPDTIAKFLFTSGSMAAPKAVINTQRMLCSNQAAKGAMWPFLARQKPVIVDWLPWSHTFGGNHNFNMILRWGGSIYIDDGKPEAALLGRTVRNLTNVAPTMYFSVPRAYDMLIPLLRGNQALRRNFFSRLQLIVNSGAALPQHLWDELQRLAVAEVGTAIVMLSSWGSTETAPAATDCHFQAKRSGVIGVPIPGTELKLVPMADKLEVRVKGPNVFPGYWKQPALTAQAFDEDGFYRIGDAVEFVDEAQPELGLLFDGRVAEDFKLLSGTWVHVGSLRVKGLDALSQIGQDIVVTGHDRDALGFLVFPNFPECRRLCPDLPADAPIEAVLAHSSVRSRVREGMAAMSRDLGSSTHPVRVMLLSEPPSAEAGEITDKGYVNQRAVLNRRAELVRRLHADPPDDSILTLDPEMRATNE